LSVRPAAVLLALLLVACGPVAQAPAASPTAALPTISAFAASSRTPPRTAQPSASQASNATPIALPATASVAAAGGGIVWALVANSRLFRSRDRGDTWEERTPPPGAALNGNIAFVDDQAGWSLADGSAGSGCQSQYFEVWRTTDAALTWTDTFKSDSTSDTGCKAALAFADAQRGYISVSGRDVAPATLRTTDGGRAWSRSQVFPGPPGFRFEPSVSNLTPGAVADFGSVLLVSARAQMSGDVHRHIYRSTDGGATWSYFAPAPTDADTVFLTRTRWLQIGVPGSSQETIDGGTTWHSFATDYTQAAPVPPQVVFGDANVGYASVRGSIQRTVDGGAHWTAIKTPGT